MLHHLKANEPVHYEGLMEIALAWDTPERVAVKNRIWPTLPKTAIDYAVAEPAADSCDVDVIPADSSWDDVGDFAAIVPAEQCQGSLGGWCFSFGGVAVPGPCVSFGKIG